MPLSEKRLLIDQNNRLSIAKQTELLGINRTSLYYEANPMSGLNLELMQKMDEHYLKYPYKGAPRMYVYLTEDLGYKVSKNRVERLYYDVMGLRAIFPGPHTSKRNKAHKIYPYLLRALKITHPRQAYGCDITVIILPKGYMYLVAMIDLYSRFVVNWSLSNTMLASWCVECYREAIQEYGVPEIFNTDQGSQFTSNEFSQAVIESGAKLSMDGKGRATDNAFIENLWKMLKYEDIYLKAYEDGLDLYRGIAKYFYNWNFNRRHSSIGDKYPAELFLNSLAHKAS